MSGDECPGKFERDFDVLDEDLGSGEFGRVLKVRRKLGNDGYPDTMNAREDVLYAIKKSKPIEGVKHRYVSLHDDRCDAYIENGIVFRLRLREEVDILKLLTEASEGGRGHPSVLRYVDNWEQDGLLFIQTELCALGSFGRFLWDYGRKFPRLDEARVWKILAELTEVCGSCCLLCGIFFLILALLGSLPPLLSVAEKGHGVHPWQPDSPSRSEAGEHFCDLRRQAEDRGLWYGICLA